MVLSVQHSAVGEMGKVLPLQYGGQAGSGEG